MCAPPCSEERTTCFVNKDRQVDLICYIPAHAAVSGGSLIMLRVRVRTVLYGTVQYTGIRSGPSVPRIARETIYHITLSRPRPRHSQRRVGQGQSNRQRAPWIIASLQEGLCCPLLVVTHLSTEFLSSAVLNLHRLSLPFDGIARYISMYGTGKSGQVWSKSFKQAAQLPLHMLQRFAITMPCLSPCLPRSNSLCLYTADGLP